MIIVPDTAVEILTVEGSRLFKSVSALADNEQLILNFAYSSPSCGMRKQARGWLFGMLVANSARPDLSELPRTVPFMNGAIPVRVEIAENLARQCQISGYCDKDYIDMRFTAGGEWMAFSSAFAKVMAAYPSMDKVKGEVRDFHMAFIAGMYSARAIYANGVYTIPAVSELIARLTLNILLRAGIIAQLAGHEIHISGEKPRMAFNQLIGAFNAPAPTAPAIATQAGAPLCAHFKELELIKRASRDAEELRPVAQPLDTPQAAASAPRVLEPLMPSASMCIAPLAPMVSLAPKDASFSPPPQYRAIDPRTMARMLAPTRLSVGSSRPADVVGEPAAKRPRID